MSALIYAFIQEKSKPSLTINLGLALTSFRTPRPWFESFTIVTSRSYFRLKTIPVSKNISYLILLLLYITHIPFQYLFHIIYGCYAVHNLLTHVTFTLTAIHYLNYPDLLPSGLVAQSVERR